jgi:hypothetical protein
MMKSLGLKVRVLATLAVLCCLAGASSKVAQAQTITYTSDGSIGDFTSASQISSYAQFSNYSSSSTIIPLPAVICTSGGQLCSPSFTTAVNLSQTGPITINYTASPEHCSNIQVLVSLDGTLVTTSAFLMPGQSTGPILLTSTASAGSHTIGLQAQGEVGGCNEGVLSSWTGTLTITAQTTSTDASSCPGPTFTPTADELAMTGCRVYDGGSLTGLDPSNNWILATFTSPVSTIVVFPNIDHYGSAYDGYQYQIWGSNDQVHWTFLYDATGVTACSNGCAAAPYSGEPFTLGSWGGTPPSTVNNVLTPQTTGVDAGCSGDQEPFVGCAVGYIAQFNFDGAYQFYAFGASTQAMNSGNADQELSAVGALNVPRGPRSGVVLTITDSNNNLVSAIWDSQMHSGTLLTVPVGGPSNCNATDQIFQTDAFAFQGSSWTGCNPGDMFSSNGTNPGVVGTKIIPVTGGQFTFTTHFDSVTGEAPPECNTNNTICIGSGKPSLQTGFLTVTNSGSNSFTGTITLSGTPNIVGGTYCPTGPFPATDSITGTLGEGQQWTFALAEDSGNCGGWGADLTLPITAMAPTTFLFGKDSFQITPTNSNPGDTILFRPIAMPQSYFNMPGPTLMSSPVGSGQGCITYADFSAEGGGAENVGNNNLGVCAELQTTCLNQGKACLDGETFGWSGALGFVIDQYSLPAGVGGVNFLGEKAVSCPQNTYSTDGLISFTGSAPGTDPPLHPGGSGLNCFVATYTPGATPITQGTTTAFLLQFPSSTKLNKVCPGCLYGFVFQQDSGASIPPVPLTNLHYCFNPTGTTSPTGCGTAAHPVPIPWVFPEKIPFQCLDGTAPNFPAEPVLPTLGLLGGPGGEYVFNAIQLPIHERGCFVLQLNYSFGLTVPAATFEIVPF